MKQILKSSFLIFYTLILFTIFLLDIATPKGIIIWLLYIVPVLLIARQNDRRSVIIISTLSSFLIITGFFISLTGSEPEYYAIIHRVIGLFVLWIVTYISINRIQAEKKLHKTKTELDETEHRYAKLFNAKTNGIAHCRIITDENGKVVDYEILQINEAYTVITGLRKEQIEGKTAREVFPGIENFGYDYITNYGRVALENIELNIEIYFEPLNRWLSVYVHSPKYREFTAMFTDISERKKTEAALRISEEKFRIYTETIPNLMFIVDANNELIYNNERFKSYLGTDNTHGKGWENIDVHHPEDTAKITASWLESIKTGKPYEVEYRIRRYDGQYRWHLTRAIPIRDDKGAIKEWVGTSTDIHETKLIQEENERLLVELQHRAAEAEEGRNLLLALMEYVPEGITIADAPDLNIRMVSRHGTELLIGARAGMKVDEVINKWKVYYPDGTPMPLEDLPLTRAIEKGEIVRDCELIQKNLIGEQLWLLCNASPVYNANGEIVLGIVAWHDITQRKQAEIEQQHLAEQKQLVLKAAKMGWWHYDPITRIATWDDRYKEIFQVTGYERPNDEILTRIHTEDLPVVWALVEAALDPVNPKPYSSEYRIFWDDGSMHWIEAHGMAVFDGAGEARHAVSFLGTVQDISDRKWAENAIRESEERFRTLADNISQLAWMADEKGSIFWYNERWFTYSGTTPDEMKNFGWNKILHPLHLKRVLDSLQHSWNTGENWEDTFPMKNKDGEYRWFLSRAVPILNSSGNIFRWLGTHTDITEEKQIQETLLHTLEELQRSNRDLEQFAYVASHDLQEPVRMVKLYSQLLENYKESGLDRKALNYMGFISEGAGRMHQLVNDLLEYSRLAIKVKDFEKVDCNELVQEVVKDLTIVIAEEMATIQYEELPFVKGDRTQIRQLFQNLIQNSIKFRGKYSPVISIKSIKQENFWLFSVTDNGIGIDKEFFEKIFIIFQRLHARDEYPGTGIGLALCKKIVEHHGGRIWVESEINKGTAFYFTLPEF